MSDEYAIAGWTPERLGGQEGRTFVITGANSGLGLEASKVLAARGARIVMLCRNPARAEIALQLVRDSGDGEVTTFVLDLADLACVRAAAQAVGDQAPAIDGLVCNAGIMMPPTRTLTKDGFELQLGVNHYGHFLLAGLLYPQLAAAGGRIVTVSSLAHRAGLKRLNFEDLNFATGYGPIAAYAQSKLANLMFGLELDRRLRAAASRVMAVVCHPGYAATNLQTSGPRGLMRAILRLTNPLLAQSAAQGAWSQLFAAAAPEAVGGAYYGPGKRGHTRGPIGLDRPSHAAREEEAARRLWQLSQEATQFTWPI